MAEATKVYFGARLFDGDTLREDFALVVEGGRVAAIMPVGERPRGARQIDLGGGVLSPGFVDWQVNGGGGVLFNADPTPEGIAKIAAAHRAFGTTTIVPTIITDEKRVLDAALDAARAAGGGWHQLALEDGSLQLELSQVAYVRVESDELRVGFGA